MNKFNKQIKQSRCPNSYTVEALEMDPRPLNLLDEALGLDPQSHSWPLSGRLVLVKDCVETSGAFVLHHLLKRALSPLLSSSAVIFVAFSQPFSHYDRVLRKLGCNLVAHREVGRFFFFDMLVLECPDDSNDKTSKSGLHGLFSSIHKAMCAAIQNNKNSATIVIDDVSLMEVSAKGSVNSVIDFLHYCHTLTSEYGCSLITLIHEDIYVSTDKPSLVLEMEYDADISIRAEPLTTGLATDVHGQLTIYDKEIGQVQGSLRDKTSRFQFKIKENSVEYFYPGSRT